MDPLPGPRNETGLRRQIRELIVRGPSGEVYIERRWVNDVMLIDKSSNTFVELLKQSSGKFIKIYKARLNIEVGARILRWYINLEVNFNSPVADYSGMAIFE